MKDKTKKLEKEENKSDGSVWSYCSEHDTNYPKGRGCPFCETERVSKEEMERYGDIIID